MDPFTEKLLERTRARRENLQKKMAERPTAANRQMAKRAREPLAETNSVMSEPPVEKVLPSSKPSPSKRRCSEENMTGEENKEPVALPFSPSDSITDKNLPVPSNNRSVETIASVEKGVVSSNSESVKGPTCLPPSTDNMMLCQSQKVTMCADKVMKPPVMEVPKDNPAPTKNCTSMRSRLQRLADQRQYWDLGDCVPDGDAPSPLKNQTTEILTTSAPTPVTSGTPVGRKGRLANLAATISSWEDDLGHQPIHRDNAPVQHDTASVPPPSLATTNVVAKSSAAMKQPQHTQSANKPVYSKQQLPVYSPVKSSRVIPPSPQKIEVPESKLAKEISSPTPSPKKAYSSQPSTPVKSVVPSSSPHKTPLPQSPLKSHTPSKDLGSGRIFSSGLIKPNLPTKPSSASASVSHASEKSAKETANLQQNNQGATAGGVKSFLERFGERCQERQGSPIVGQGRTPVTSSATPSATSSAKSRLFQERLPTTQTTSTTAMLTQKQKMEREAELAQVRNRFQAGNMWKSKEDLAEVKDNLQSEELQDESHAPVIYIEPSKSGLNILETPCKISELDEKPAQSSHLEQDKASIGNPDLPKQKENKEAEEEICEIEMNVDGSVNSEVINDLFEGVLDENESCSAEEGEEEDALNISSMSLLVPVVETVASVVKSPERKPMTSTPASSFIHKSGTPESASRPTKFQRARLPQAGTSDGTENVEGQKLLYSIDAYRSTRVKETERPQVKQVIVRKEDVSERVGEPSSPRHTSIKQKMQILTNEMNLQQTVIHQASQALNCCTDVEHGKGSQVEAEAERLLLIATEKRVAVKADLDRLKAEGPTAQKKSSSRAREDQGVPASTGSITLQELRLPLKADFVCSTANKPESGNHYFFVMIRAGAENTVATPLANTHSALSGDALTFSTRFTLPDVSSDFEIDLEVYYLVQKREFHLDKRKKPSKSKAITPKRFLAITKSSLQTPVVASPGGPNAVRTSNFVLVGSHKLTLASIGKNKFPLEKIKCQGSESKLLSDMFQNKVPFLCPLEGHVYLKIQCEVGSRVEERGFLTMFEDVSGFGAWHRRWCVLSGYYISYWTYPDDEKRKSPIGRINLACCTSRKVEPANREFCARPNTFELITVRPQREDDKETLVTLCKNTMCVTKNWLSADTKEERNLWMQKLNQILVDLRMWQPDSCYRPA